ncbi:MAG: hypothetical protein HYT08_04740 [Candidatus Levybacteria bacterium]|nr:hypothetical protein [Candidatus Levybacteria bacterium]
MAIIAVLAVVVFVALNPAQRLEDTRDAKRVSDTQTILTAIHASIVDNAGALPSGLTAGMSQTQIGTAATGCGGTVGVCSITPTGCVDLTTPLANYLNTIPIDPTGGTTYTAAETGYSVVVSAAGLVTVTACGTEGATTISASR